MNLDEMTKADLEAGRPDLVKTIQEEAIAGVEAEVEKLETEMRAESQQAVEEPEEKPEAQVAESDRVAKLEDELAGMRAREVVQTALSESDISDSGAILVRRRFEQEKAADAAEFRTLVEAEIEAVGGHEKAIVEAMRVPGLPGMPISTEGDAEEWDTKKEVAGYYGIELDGGDK